MESLPTPPLPKPSVKRAPKLTAQSRQADKQLGVSPPGAGGWIPKESTPYLLGGAAATLGALAVSIPAAGMGTPYQFPCIIIGALCAAVGIGVGVVKSMQSAGPRSPTE